MCGRFTYTVDRVETILERFKAILAPGFEGYKASYNAAPGSLVPAVAAKDGNRYLMNMLWGIVPPWGEKDGESIIRQINVRDDTIARNAFFRSRLLNNRCIFVADGFYEWQTPAAYRRLPREERLPKGVYKTPFRIRTKEHELFPLAGLWRTVEIDSKPIVTAAIITTSPSEFMKDIHDRMPVIFNDEQLDLWLDPAYREYPALQHLLAPYKGALEAYPVSNIVNSNHLDDPRCIEPIR